MENGRKFHGRFAQARPSPLPSQVPPCKPERAKGTKLATFYISCFYTRTMNNPQRRVRELFQLQ